MDDIKKYEKFINDWHYFLKEYQDYALSSDDSKMIKAVSMYILQQFYLAPYADGCGNAGEDPDQPPEDFYEIFSIRLEHAEKALRALL